ncbi:MAG TPA: PspC domain-containing protein, partial [Solirubrobacteraceae bacterium]|nr:PspC domain-containing protein [Solirubrobacteraceae bacterium]
MKPRLRRNMDDVWIAGVCSGFARRIGVEAAWIRLLMIVFVLFGGFGIPVYALGWVLIAPDAESGHRRLPRTGRGAVEVAVGASLLVLAALLTLRATGLWVADVLTWPMVLLVGGAALIWRTSQTSPPPPSVDAPKTTPRAQPVSPERVAEVQRERAGWAAAVLSRTGLGIALVVAAAFVFIRGTGAIAQAWDALLVIFVVLLIAGVIFAPWLVRLVRSLGEERSERIRSQERAEVAAHLHDSVLQTLALIQKRSSDPAQ